jgi:tetrahydrodipicolinate N-succinyltransferase
VTHPLLTLQGSEEPLLRERQVPTATKVKTVTTTINIYVKMVTQDAEEAMKKLETKCSRVVPQTVPQLPLQGTNLGTKNGVITVQQAQPLEAVRENLAERGDSNPRQGVYSLKRFRNSEGCFDWS